MKTSVSRSGRLVRFAAWFYVLPRAVAAVVVLGAIVVAAFMIIGQLALHAIR